MINWAKVDLFLIVLVVSLSVIFLFIKRDSPNWWTGLFLLGMLPVLVSDYLKDRKKVGFNSEKSKHEI